MPLKHRNTKKSKFPISKIITIIVIPYLLMACGGGSQDLDEAPSQGAVADDGIETINLVLKKAAVTTPAFDGILLDVTSLTVSTLFSEQRLSSDGGALLDFVDGPLYQLVFVSKNIDSAIAVAYVDSESINNSNITITTESIAKGVILSMPLMIGYNEGQRLAILSQAMTFSGYLNLVQKIESALATDPGNLLNETVFPEIYEGALLLISDVIDTLSTDQFSQVVGTRMVAIQEKSAFALKSSSEEEILGNEDTPHLQDAPGVVVDAVNTEMVFYSIVVDEKIVGLATPKMQQWEWSSSVELDWTNPFGWDWSSPLVWVSTEPVHTPISLGDGNYNISLITTSPDSEAGQYAGAANLVKASCLIIDFVSWCPITNQTISRLGAEKLSPLVDLALIDSLRSAPEYAFSKIIDWMLKPENWLYIAITLYGESDNKKATTTFLNNTLTIIKSANIILKGSKAASVQIPFAWNLVSSPKVLQWCIIQNSEVLSATCNNTEPTAVIDILGSPVEIFLGDMLIFDASASSDQEYESTSLEVRWDFDGDGLFDTGWLVEKNINYSYTSVGLYEVVLQVRDPSGLIGSTLKEVSVSALGSKYAKVNGLGQAISNTATDWDCILDRESRLMWEKKTNSGGLRHRGWTYMNTTNLNGEDPRNNYDWGQCFSSSSDSDGVYCHTEGYVSAINVVGLCGFNDWRVPSIEELESLIEQNEDSPYINMQFFPYTSNWYYWSSSQFSTTAAKYVQYYVYGGFSWALDRQNSSSVRLVRDAQ